MQMCFAACEKEIQMFISSVLCLVIDEAIEGIPGNWNISVYP